MLFVKNYIQSFRCAEPKYFIQRVLNNDIEVTMAKTEDYYFGEKFSKVEQ